MSLSFPGAELPERPVEPEPEDTESRVRRVRALIPFDRIEPSSALSEADALATWCAISSLWHPTILAAAGALPEVVSVDAPPGPRANGIDVVPEGRVGRLPAGYRDRVEAAGAALIEGGEDRDGLVADLLGGLGIESPRKGDELTKLALDFMALGTNHWWLRDLTIAMGHADGLNHESFAREVLGAANAWVADDPSMARNSLRAAYELLAQARERFYPLDAYLIDICLLDSTSPAGSIADTLSAHAPVTFLAQADAIEAQAEDDPDSLAKLRESINEGWADVVGGAYREGDDPLLPLASILWQFRKGGETYRAHLDQRNVETYARRRFALYPMLPQIAKGFGFRFAVHLALDAGQFPLRPEAKRLWESPDRTSLETLTRPPVAADLASQAAQMPWKLAVSMKDDHVATLALVHWPGDVSGWWLDLRRAHAYAAVLARRVTLNDYFHLTDRPYETFGVEPDKYVTPYLSQAVRRRDDAPVSRKAEHARLRARFDTIKATRAIAETLGTATGVDETDWNDVENLIETDRGDQARATLESAETVWAAAVARGIVGTSTGGRPGYLVINPSGVARRAAVTLPDAALDLRPEGPLRAAQFTDEGVVAIIELPAFGYAWVPRESSPTASANAAGSLVVRDRLLRNGSISVEIDKATGGIRSLMGEVDETARLGQQIVAVGLKTLDGQPGASRMRCDGFDVEFGGPALLQAVSHGAILGPGERSVAAFKQRIRLWSGRPILELRIEFSDLDASLTSQLAKGDPWACYLGIRWAWPDPSATLRRTVFSSPELTEVPRPETPDAIDISTRRQRTALLFGGLAHHQKHGTRMLDTLLVAGRESARTFDVGVVLDLEHPFQAVTDFVAHTYVVPTKAGPPKNGPTGWLFQIDNKGIAVVGLTAIEPGDESEGWGLAFVLQETTGRPARCRLRIFRNPNWAKQTDFVGNVIVDLPTDGDAVLVDFTPHELARVEVILG